MLTSRRAAIAGGVLAVLMVLAAVVALTAGSSGTQVAALVGEKSPDLIPPEKAPAVPELAATSWFQTPPLTSAKLRGSVVLVDFWDASCINCRRTFPFLQRLSTTYKAAGLVVLGVHSPEFPFEKSDAYVQRSAKELGVTWPVANDPEMVIWSAFQNQYWPAQYLVDRAGRVRLFHAGEGGDAAVEQAVRALLDEGGQAPAAHVGEVVASEVPGSATSPQTPERYLGAARGAGSLVGGAVIPPGTTVTRSDPAPPLDQVGLTGPFTGRADEIVAGAGARVSLRFNGRDVYAVLAPGSGPGPLTVLLDGQPVPSSRRGPALSVTPEGSTQTVVGQEDLYHLLTGEAETAPGGTLTLIDPVGGTQFFTFTFGG